MAVLYPTQTWFITYWSKIHMNDTRNIHNNIVKLQVVSGNVVNNVVNDNFFSNKNSVAIANKKLMELAEEARMEHAESINSTPPSVSLKSYLRDLVREYADMHLKTKDEWIDEGYSIWVHTLFDHDKRILLSHIVDADDYEYYCSSPERLHSGFEEYEKTMQKMIDDTANELYHEDLDYMGLRVNSEHEIERYRDHF